MMSGGCQVVGKILNSRDEFPGTCVLIFFNI